MVPSQSEESEDDGSNHGSARSRTNPSLPLPMGLRPAEHAVPFQIDSFGRDIIVERDSYMIFPNNYMNGRINNHYGDINATPFETQESEDDDDEDSLSDLPALEGGEDDEEDTDAIGEEQAGNNMLIFNCCLASCWVRCYRFECSFSFLILSHHRRHI